MTTQQHVDKKVLQYEGNKFTMNIHFTSKCAQRENVEDFVGIITENVENYEQFISTINTGFTLQYRSVEMKGYIEPVINNGVEGITVKIDFIRLMQKNEEFKVVHNLRKVS